MTTKLCRKSFCKKFSYFNEKPITTLCDVNSQLVENSSDLVAQSKYTQIIGSLMHLINFSRLDIAYIVCRLSKYAHNST